MMMLRKVDIYDGRGRPTRATLRVCSCGHEVWVVYAIDVQGEPHEHFQCVGCGSTYCDGACAANLDDDSHISPG
jgi:hypothetical protein